MNTNSTDLSLLQTNQLPSLRIAYKNSKAVERKPAAITPKSGSKKSTRKSAVKEPLPMFDDYKFKAKDHDPL